MYFVRSPIRPVPALAFLVEPHARTPCLVVFIPGLLDGPETIRDRELARHLRATGARCDSVAIDATYRYYFGAEIGSVLYADVLLPATVRGYEEIWLVGFSLGGLGAVLTARAHPELVDGVILLSPFLGLEGVGRDVSAAGGLAEWRPPDPLPDVLVDDNFTLLVWAWLQRLHTDPDNMPDVFVGWANGERLSTGAELLAAVLPAERSLEVEGGHGWASWTPLFVELATRAGIGRGGR